VGLFKKV